jgi:hypothetical protein
MKPQRVRASMRWSAGLALLALLLAGCASPLTPVTTFNGPEIRASFEVHAYDSDGDNATDGIALRLLSATPPPPLVGSDVVIDRNGDTNVTVWRCAERDARVCQSNRGILSWNTGETIYIRGVPGANRLNVAVRERFVYNTTLRVDATRDTEVWAVLNVRPYDSNGNGTADGFEVSLTASDKAPFQAGEVHILENKVDMPVFRDPQRLAPFTGQWNPGTSLYVKGLVIGENRVEVFLRATRYDTGFYVVGE